MGWARGCNQGGFVFRLPAFLPLASLPQECEKELLSLCHSLVHRSLICSWDQGKEKGTLGRPKDQVAHPLRLYFVIPGFCQALGSALGGQSSPASPAPTAELLQRLFPPLLDSLRQPRSELSLCQPAGETGGVESEGGGGVDIIFLPSVLKLAFS